MSILIDEKSHRSSRSTWLRLVVTVIGILIMVSGLAVMLGQQSGSAKEALGLEYAKPSVEVLDLEATEVEQLKKLGLSPKPKLKIAKGGDEQVLHGRFLHITDMHPDKYYKTGADVGSLCHSGKGSAGKYGDAVLGCDSPMVLMEDTLKWVKENLKDKIDFVVWTGDNVRHDNDRRYPRTESNIFDMNQKVSDLMYETFKEEKPRGGRPRQLKVPLVPSLGNNDVFPHNLFSPGPTLQTRELFKIWHDFVPAAQLHIFNRGAYFFKEIIPNELAVLSINTLYLFQSNPLVDNCDRKKDPGHKLFEWLGYTLKEMRARGMKVWLSGHVPPNEKNYDISCLRKYIVWVHEYRDVIIGGLYGHMNIDHFIPLDSKEAYKSIKRKFGKLGFDYELSFENDLYVLDDDDNSDSDSDSVDEDTSLEESYSNFNSPILKDGFEDSVNFKNMDDIRIQGGVPNGKVGYMENVRKEYYANVKGKRKSGYVSERYSIAHVAASVVPTFNSGLRVWEYNITDLQNLLTSDIQPRFAPWDEFFEGLEKLMEKQVETDYDDEFITFGQQVEIFKNDNTFPPKMPKSKSLGPAYIPQVFTPERYVQYYADLANINRGEKEFSYEFEYATDDKVYDMDSLTVDDWISLARRLGKPVKEKKDKKNKSNKKSKKNKKNKDKRLLENSEPLKQDGSKDSRLEQDHIQQSARLEKLWQHYLKYSFVSSEYENMGMG